MTEIGFHDQLLLNAGQKHCRMLPLKHSAILLTFIKLPFVIKIFVLSILSGHFTQVLLYIRKVSKSCELYFQYSLQIIFLREIRKLAIRP